MEENKTNLNYFMVNVLGHYSFMVTTTDNNISNEDIIDRCVERDLFEENEDSKNCYIDNCITDRDKEFFEHCTFNID